MIWLSSVRQTRTPQGLPRGETVSGFLGYAGSTQLGRPFKALQPVTLGLTGFGGASICLQPIVGWRTMTPRDVRARIAVLSRSGRFLRGDQESLRRPEHSSSSPLFSALHSALCYNRSPFRSVDEPYGIPFASLTIPLTTPQRRILISRGPSGQFAH